MCFGRRAVDRNPHVAGRSRQRLGHTGCEQPAAVGDYTDLEAKRVCVLHQLGEVRVQGRLPAPLEYDAVDTEAVDLEGRQLGEQRPEEVPAGDHRPVRRVHAPVAMVIAVGHRIHLHGDRRDVTALG